MVVVMADDDFGLFSYKIFRPIARRYAKKVFRDVEIDLEKIRNENHSRRIL